MKFLIVLVILFFIVSNLQLFLFIFTEYRIVPYALHDIFYYFKHKNYNLCKEFGRIRLNCASGSSVFGSGKTLDIVKRALTIKKRYDGLEVWDSEAKKFVVQHINIISNVELYGVEFIRFKDISQLIDIDKYNFGSMDVTIFILDESGAIFNSRDYKNNISPEFLTSLLQSRKNKICLYMTSQRFMFTDKILREVCATVNQCRMWWRIVRIQTFDAYQLENAYNDSLIKPLHVRYWLASDKDFKSYNSFQLIENMRKDYEPNKYLGTAEILQKANVNSNPNAVTTYKKRFRRSK